MSISEGTHDYGRASSEDAFARMYAERAARVAAEMDADTADVRADMVIMADGAIMSGRLAARGDRGWLFDEDRDSQVAAKLRELVASMDDLVAAFLRGDSEHDAAMEIDAAHAIADAWVAIRKITQGRDITEGNGS